MINYCTSPVLTSFDTSKNQVPIVRGYAPDKQQLGMDFNGDCWSNFGRFPGRVSEMSGME